MIDVSLIVVSYNTRDLLRDCLTSVPGAGGDLGIELFVVDNASRDGSADMVSAEFPSAKLLRNPSNAGFAAANNAGLQRASGRYVVLLNSDTVSSPGAFSQLVEFMDRTPTAGYCGPRLVNGDGTHQPSARRFPTTVSAGFSMLGLSQRFPSSRHTLNLHTARGDRKAFQADWLSGACLMVRAETVRKVGPLDEGFFLYFEETDWCHRMADAGWEGWYVPLAEVVHFGGGSVVCDAEHKPFSGDHPAFWVSSSRRYVRRYHGMIGMISSECIQVLLYSLIWLRHRWRSNDRSRRKAKTAAAAIHCLIDRTHTSKQVEARSAG